MSRGFIMPKAMVIVSRVIFAVVIIALCVLMLSLAMSTHDRMERIALQSQHAMEAIGSSSVTAPVAEDSGVALASTSDDEDAISSILGSADADVPEGIIAIELHASDGDVYLITRGETLSEISARYGVSVDRLAAANEIHDVNLIYEGSALRIPDPPMLDPDAR